MSKIDLFWKKVEISGLSSCWKWIAATTDGGYGVFNGFDGKTITAHRFSYELHVSPVSKNLVVDHLCYNPWCVNPDHLEMVTEEENNFRVRKKTHCQKGHEYTVENTMWRNRQGRNPTRACRECNRVACKKNYRKRKNGD